MIGATLQNKKLHLVLITLFFGCLAFGAAHSAIAQQSSSTIAQGFQADNSKGTVVPGSLVSAKNGNLQSVELATIASAGRLAGVVDNKPLVAISSSQEVQVVLSGTTNILVSDINGPIKAGDKITASPIAGVGMLAVADSQVVGTAQAAVTSTSTKTITDREGKAHLVRIGRVPIQVGVAYYQAPGSNFLPPFIQSVANSVAGRPVSLVRVLLSSVLLLLSFISVSILIYSSVRSAMTSLGRNPLAARAIRRGLYQVSIVTLVIIGGTILVSYLILSL